MFRIERPPQLITLNYKYSEDTFILVRWCWCCNYYIAIQDFFYKCEYQLEFRSYMGLIAVESNLMHLVILELFLDFDAIYVTKFFRNLRWKDEQIKIELKCNQSVRS